MRPAHRVLILTIVLAGCSAAAAAGLLDSYQPFSSVTHVPWWMLAVGFLCTEVFTIHVDVRRDTYSISMMELPLVIGLFLTAPLALLGARIGGSAAALMLDRRHVALKSAFNLALYATETVVAVIVFRSVAGHVGAVDPRTWAAAALAMLAANLCSLGGVILAMRLHGASLTGRLPSMARGALVPPVATTSLGLAAVALLWTEPTSAWLLAAVVAVLVAAYQGYASLNRRYANLQRLYDFTRRIQANGDDAAVREILLASADVMRADQAMLVVFDGDRSQVAVLGDGKVTEHETDTAALDPIVTAVIERSGPLLLPHSPKEIAGRELLVANGWRDCVAVPVQGDHGVTAVMVVANRADDVSTFDRDDVRLFEALVNHCAIALDNTQLLNRLRYDALHDSLTGLANRALFHLQVEQAIATRPTGTKLAVLLMDLDRFKEVNDTLGHHYGDQLLGEVGRRLARIKDRGGTVARLGGDEFALLLPDLADADEAFAEARRVSAVLGEPFALGELNVDIEGTIGLAVCPDHGEDPATLLQRADVAMYAAKTGNGIEIYASERDHYSPRRLALVGELREAIEHEDLVIHYQAKVDVASGAIVGAEALVRWHHATRGMVPPDDFIPIAEQTGLIRPLTLYVLRRAAADCARWQAAGHDVGVAVNVSARNLADADLIERLQPLLAATALRPQSLTVEITESSIMGDINRTMAVLEELAALGVRISVDDFGTGYSSLAYLKRLPVTEVKIDKSFVQGMEEDAGDHAIVHSVIELGANLGMTVVAEGVETARALDQLRELRCPRAQGYLFSKPEPFEGFVARLDADAESGSRRPGRRGNEVRLAAV